MDAMAHHEIPLSKPDITAHEEDLVLRTLRSDRLSIGPMVDRFETLVAQRVGVKHAVACSSGTAGLHMTLLALGIGPGDEVVTTPFSFIASSNVILYTGAIPVFVDICPKSLNADPAQVEAAITDKTKAILAVEAFGNPEHMDTYARIAAKHEIPLIEDCCEALGTTLGVAQMERLDEIIAARRAVAEMYVERMAGVTDLVLPSPTDDTFMSWFVYVVRLSTGYTREERDRIIQGLRMHDVGSSDYFPCIHLQPFYQNAFGFHPGAYPIAESVSARTLALPFFSGMTKRDIEIVVQTLEVMISRENLSRRA